MDRRRGFTCHLFAFFQSLIVTRSPSLAADRKTEVEPFLNCLELITPEAADGHEVDVMPLLQDGDVVDRDHHPAPITPKRTRRMFRFLSAEPPILYALRFALSNAPGVHRGRPFSIDALE